MPAIDFPNAPTVGEQFTSGSTTWVWDGVTWDVTRATVVGPTGPSGVISVTDPVTNTGTSTEAVIGLDKSLITSDDITWSYFELVSDLPAATTNHGMFAHVHSTGEAYYAHAGVWIKLAVDSDARFTDTRTPTDDTVTTAKIVDANVTNAKLENDSITIGTTEVFLGETITSATLTGLSLTSSIVFEGAVEDDFETTLSVDEPTADRTVVIPDASGTVALVDRVLKRFDISTEFTDVAPRYDNRSATFTSGTVYWTFFTPLFTDTVSSVSVASAGTATVGATLIKSGIYSFNETTATLLASTANDTTIFGTRNTVYTRALDTNVTLEAGVRYGFAVMVVATSPGTGFLAFGYPPAALNALPPIMRGYLDGQSDLPASATPLTNTSNGYWARLT